MADALAAGHATQDEHGPLFLWAGADVVSEALA